MMILNLLITRAKNRANIYLALDNIEVQLLSFIYRSVCDCRDAT